MDVLNDRMGSEWEWKGVKPCLETIKPHGWPPLGKLYTSGYL